MDTGKILKIINDIQDDELKFGFQSKFNNILNYYNENNPEALNKEKNSVDSDLLVSILSYYVTSENKALEELGISDYFGLKSYIQINSILNSQAHEVKVKLTEFISNRNDCLSRLGDVKSSLLSFGIQPRILSNEECEIGFSLPDVYREIDKTEDVLGDIKNYLSALSEVNKESSNYSIRSVNNGCVEFSIGATIKVAETFLKGLGYLVLIYDALKMFDDMKKGLKNFTEERRRIIEENYEAQRKEKVNESIDEFVEGLNITEPENKTKVRQLFKKMIKHYEKGVGAEVRIPKLEEPVEPETDDSSLKEKFIEDKKIYELKKVVDEKNKQFYIMQQNNFYGVDTKFLEVNLESDNS